MEERGSRERAWGRGLVTRLRAGFGMLLMALFAACASTEPFVGMDGDDLWEAGLEAFEEGEWEDAIDAFVRLNSQFAGHPRSPDARMHVARAYMERGEHISAASEFERFLQLYPSHGLAPEAALGICQAYSRAAPHPQRDQTYTRRAADVCAETAQDFQGLRVAEQADSIRREMNYILGQRRYEEGRFYQRRDLHNSAILVFEAMLPEFQETPWAARALLALYRSYRELGWSEEAEEAAERVLAQYPDSDAARELREEGVVRAAAEDGGSGP